MDPAPELELAGQKWLHEHDLAGALAVLDGLLAREPAHEKALNFAGWLRTSQRADDEAEFERGLGQLKAALAIATEDQQPAVNLSEALAAKGRAPEAVALLRPWCDAHRGAKFAWNSLGWLLGVVLGDEAAGLAALEPHAWFSDVQLNLGRIHLKARRIDAAEPHFRRALTCFRPHEAWLHLGELHATRLHLRRALGAFRRAAEVDASGEYTQPLHQAITVYGNQLLRHRKYFLHADDDSQLSQEQERPQDLPSRLPPSFAELAAQARDVRPLVPAELSADCQAIERCATDATLHPEFADQALWARLEKVGPERAKELGRQWRAAQFVLYEELLDREEPAADSVLGTLRSAIARREWDTAFAALEAIDRGGEHGVETIGGLGELLGDRLQRLGLTGLAARAFALSEDAFAQFASWSTSGAEGMGRMVDVNRLRAKRRR